MGGSANSAAFFSTYRNGPAFPESSAAATAAGQSATATAGAATVCVSAGNWNFGRRIPDVRVSDSE